MSPGRSVVRFYFLLYNCPRALTFLQRGKGCWVRATAVLPSTPPLGHPWRKGRGGQVFFQACIFSQIQRPPTGHLLSLHLSREQWVKLIRSSRSPGILTDSEFSRSFLRAVDDAGSYLSRRTRPDLCVSHSALATGWGMDGWAGRETTRRGLFLVGAHDKSTGRSEHRN